MRGRERREGAQRRDVGDGKREERQGTEIERGFRDGTREFGNHVDICMHGASGAERVGLCARSRNRAGGAGFVDLAEREGFRTGPKWG